MTNKIIVQIISICSIAILLFSSSKLNAQVKNSPNTCEDSSAQLDGIIAKAKTGDTLIVIAQSGVSEKNPEWSKRRLHNVKTYLIKYREATAFKKNPENIILATGEKTNGLGMLSFFLKGELVSRLYIGKNKDLFVGECVIDTEIHKTPCDVDVQKIFYPCLKADLDVWLKFYKIERPHQGYRKMTRKPIKTIMQFVRNDA